MKRAPRPCLQQGCSEIVKGGSYCPGHAPRHSHQAQRRHDRTRPSAAKRGYDSRWRKLRARFLTEHPFCDWCGKLANEVDHIDGNPRNNDRSNLRSMCKPCHSSRTARDQVPRRAARS